jgi:hypothetical protein
MSHRDPAAEPVTALERSLREGPPDEAGYRAEAIDFNATSDQARVAGRGRGRTAGSIGRPRSTRPLFSFADSLVVLLVLVIGGFAVVRVSQVASGPSPQPTSLRSPGPSPIPVPALTETFVSTRNGYSVRYPVGWATTAATTSWRPLTYVPIGNSALDELKKVGEARLVVASQKLAPGQSEAQWLASFAHPFDLGTCSGDRAAWPPVTVDGASGYLDIEACPLPADRGFSTPDLLFEVIVFSGGRVYQIGLDGAVDRGYFDAILATVHFDPASALDPPAGS